MTGKPLFYGECVVCCIGEYDFVPDLFFRTSCHYEMVIWWSIIEDTSNDGLKLIVSIINLFFTIQMAHR